MFLHFVILDTTPSNVFDVEFHICLQKICKLSVGVLELATLIQVEMCLRWYNQVTLLKLQHIDDRSPQ